MNFYVVLDSLSWSGAQRWPFSRIDIAHPTQSPVDIVTSKSITLDLPILEFLEPNVDNSQPATFYNSGHTAHIYIKDKPSRRPYLKGGPFKYPFVFEQMHFHWGSKDDWGSEHFLDGESFAAEIHLVYYNSKYSSFEEAAKQPDGLAVLAVFAQEEETDNLLLNPLLELLPKISSPNSSVTLDQTRALQWAASALYLNSEFYIYPGSLTTKPYSENVIFIVLPRPNTLSQTQLSRFRELREEGSGQRILDNKRQLQPLHHRPILRGTRLHARVPAL